MCNQTISLDRRVKIFKDKEKSLWMFWTAYIPQADTNSEDGSDNGVRTNLDSIGFVGDNSTYSADLLTDAGSYLMMSKSNSRTFNLPTSLDGKFNSNVFHAGYIDDGSILPIRNCYYPEFCYDEDQNELTLIFWSNVDTGALNNSSGDSGVDSAPLQFGSSDSVGFSFNSVDADIYPDSTINPISTNGYVPEAQRCLFMSVAQLRKCTVGTTNDGDVDTQWFIFSKPILLMCPGNNTGNIGDPVTDQIAAFGFSEFKLS